MIKITSSAPSDLFFPDPRDSTKGITLERLKPTEFDVKELPPAVWKRFRILHEDKQAIIETTEEIPPLDGLERIPVTAPKPAVPSIAPGPDHEPDEDKLKAAEGARLQAQRSGAPPPQTQRR